MTTEYANEVNINQLMVDHSLEVTYILADHTKIGKNSSFISCGIDKITNLITDEKAPAEICDALRERANCHPAFKKETVNGKSIYSWFI